MFELNTAIEKLEGMLEEAHQHNESGQQYRYIDGIEAALNVLRNELHAIEITMDMYVMEAN